MRPTFKKLEVKDIGDLEKLVAENVEGIEPGLKVIDSRLLLGNAAIDLVGLDAKGSLVLIALDFTADEGLLLRVMDACSWCLEYPDTFRRLYPMAQISPGRPPRILFIVERLTDSFMRRIKQLSFLEIDCLEFRHLEVNGASALYFDLVQRLRRSEAAEAATDSERQAPQVLQTPPAPEPPRAVATPSMAWIAPAPTAAQPPVIAPAPQAAPVIEPPRLVVEPAPPVVEPVRPVVAEAPAPEPPAPTLDASIAEIFAEPALSAVEEPLVEAETPAVEEPLAEQPALEIESLHATAHQQEPVAPMLGASHNPEWQTLLSQLGVEMPGRPVPAPAAPAAEPVVAAAEEPIEAPAAKEKAPEPPAPTPPAWAKPPADKAVPPAAGRTYFFAQAVKGAGPAEPQAAQPAQAAAAAPAPAAPAAPAPAKAAEVPAPDRPELDSSNFPKDGLSRQWLEFLTQLGAAK